jgi:hypothetical protein
MDQDTPTAATARQQICRTLTNAGASSLIVTYVTEETRAPSDCVVAIELMFPNRLRQQIYYAPTATDPSAPVYLIAWCQSLIEHAITAHYSEGDIDEHQGLGTLTIAATGQVQMNHYSWTTRYTRECIDIEASVWG